MSAMALDSPIGSAPRAIRIEAHRILVLDQTLLPYERREIELDDLGAAAHAIRTMQVRGAPLIGIVAAFGIALAMRESASDEALEKACALMGATRPTAVNLAWAINRMRMRLAGRATDTRAATSWDEANEILAEDAAFNVAIGTHGLALIVDLHKKLGRTVNIATHCNAGALATGACGTALAPIYAAHATNLPIHVLASETRPRNQGLLTAWELAEAGVAHTVCVDNAAGYLMARGGVDAVIVGADRIAANGDVVNKVGTYLKALAAADNGIPFYVAAPSSTIDWNCANGAMIPIEERGADEVRLVRGIDAHGQTGRIELMKSTTAVSNPAFDVTPARLVTGIICERGIAAPGGLAALFDQ